MKDQDLDILLAEYRKNNPTVLQVQKWKNLVRKESALQSKSVKSGWLQLAAASVIGFVVGALFFSTTKTNESFEHLAQIDNENATIEYVLTKTN